MLQVHLEYIYNIYCHTDKISTIKESSVWVSNCIFICYAHSWNFYIFLVSWVLDVLCRCAHGCNYCFYILFVSWELDIICCIMLCYDAGDVLTSV